MGFDRNGEVDHLVFAVRFEETFPSEDEARDSGGPRLAALSSFVHRGKDFSSGSEADVGDSISECLLYP